LLKRKDIITAIISNSMVLLLALVFFTVSVFAWFRFINYESQTKHHIFVGNFKVDIRDNDAETGQFAGALNIDLKDMYPMTEDKAYSVKYDNKQLYRFQIVNLGDVPAMYRFVVSVTDSDSNKPLSQQLKYSLMVDRDYEFLEFLEMLDFWFFNTDAPPNQYVFNTWLDAPRVDNISLQDCLDAVTLDSSKEEFNATNGEIKQGESVYFSICFWLSDQATLNTAANKTTTITLKAFFMQSVGGARWPSDGSWQDWGT